MTVATDDLPLSEYSIERPISVTSCVHSERATHTSPFQVLCSDAVLVNGQGARTI